KEKKESPQKEQGPRQKRHGALPRSKKTRSVDSSHQHNLDLIRRISQTAFNRSACWRLALIDPGIPGTIHTNAILDIRQEHLCRQNASLVTTQLSQQTINNAQHILGLTLNIQRQRLIAGNLTREIGHTIVNHHVAQTLFNIEAFEF